jgi:hypothetical protein
MDEGNIPILVDAKTEYTKQLINIISPVIYKGIKVIYNESKNKCLENDDLKSCLSNFQKDLSDIPKWNQITITEKYNNVIEYSKCDWLDDLLTAVFVSHTKILSSINTNKNKNKINLQIPKVDYFIHHCYIEVAREFWKNPYLFDDNVNNFEYQRNRRDASQIIENIVGETIRKQLPVKNILKEYLGSEYSEDNVDNIESSNNITDNLRKLVKNEIENCSKEKLSALNIETPNNEEEDNSLTKEDINAFKNTSVENLDDSIEINSETKKIEEITDENGNLIKINKVEDNDLKLDNIDELINNEVDKLELVSANDYELNAKDLDENLSKELIDLSQLEEVYMDSDKNDSIENNNDLNNENIKLEIKNDSNILSDSSNILTDSSNILTDSSNENIKLEIKNDSNILSDSSNILTDSSNILTDSSNENIKLEIKNDEFEELKELNLDSLDDLDFDINNLESDNEDNDKQNENTILIPKNEDNVKTIVIDTKQYNLDNKYDTYRNLEINNEETPRKKVFNRYSSKRKKDFSFFNDALAE